MSVTTAIKNAAQSIGEGPFWDAASQSLLYVDINEGDVHKWNSLTGKDIKVHFDGTVGFVVPRTSGGYVIGLNKSIASFNDWDSNKHNIIAEVDEEKQSRINDAKCDPSGRLWFGTMGLEKVPLQMVPSQGSLYSMDKSQQVRKHVTDIEISNGMAWSSDNTIMYYIDSIPRKVYAFDYDNSNGTISNQRVAVDFAKEPVEVLGYPDGMCIDTEGKLWVACFSAGKVVRFDPETGASLQTVTIPASRTTSCCFGGPNMDELYVTCSRVGASEDELKREPLAGSVFKVTGLGVTGTPSTAFEG